MKLFFICSIISISLSIFGGEMDYNKIKKQYPDADFVVFDKNISITYFINPQSGQLNAKALYNITLLSLTDNCNALKNIQIPFDAFEELNVLSAKYLILSENNDYSLAENVKVKFLKSKDFYVSGIFYNDLKVKEISATVSIKEKMVLKYSYEYIYRDTRFLNRLAVQENNENILNYNLTINIPEYVEAKLHSFNISNPNDIITSNENGNKIIQYKSTNISKIKLNSYSPPLNYFIPSFILSTGSYTYNGSKNKILESTDDLYEWCSGLIKQLNPDRTIIKKLAAEITAGKNTSAEKTEAIFKWVQNNIHYVAFEDGIAGFKPEEAHKVITLRYGDCKGMANALVELLKAAGVEAFHTWIGTRHINYPISANSLSVHNHMICTVNLNNEMYFLDATDKGALWNKVPSHIQGKEALIGKGEVFEVKTLPVTPANENYSEYNFNCSFSGNLRFLKTHFNYSLKGDDALELYNYYNFSNSSHRKELVDNISLFFDISSFYPDSIPENQLINIDKLKVEGTSKGTFYNATAYDGKKLYLYLNQFAFLKDININNMETPLYFPFKKKYIITYTISIPNQLKLPVLPQNKTFNTSDNSIVYKLSFSMRENKLVISREITLDTLYFEFHNNVDSRKIIENIHHVENTPIVFYSSI